MKKLLAAGAVFVAADTKRILLNLRSKEVSKAGNWGFFGGKIKDSEKILEGLSRELMEEIGFIPKYIKVYPVDIFRSDDDKFNYYSILIIVDKEFIPDLQYESDGYCWTKIGSWPKPLHPGAKAVLCNNNFEKNILEVLERNK